MQRAEDLAATMEQLQAQMADMARHIAYLEQRNGALAPASAARAASVSTGITEDELLAISAAIGAYLGVRAHIRQIRLVSTAAWAQEGRVSIQASHRLQG